jgi:hypothetical protein
MSDLIRNILLVVAILSTAFASGMYWGERKAEPRISALQAALDTSDAMAKQDTKTYTENAHELSEKWSDRFNTIDTERKRLLLVMSKGDKASQSDSTPCTSFTLSRSNEQAAFRLACTSDAIIAEACKEYMVNNHIPKQE